jgi:amphi-Trp domain-containing protein
MRRVNPRKVAMGGKKRFSYESVEDLESVLKYLQAIRQGFIDGRLSFAHRDQNLVLEPRGLLDFALEASSKGKAHSLKMKFKWKDKSPEEEAEPQPLSISTGPECV